MKYFILISLFLIGCTGTTEKKQSEKTADTLVIENKSIETTFDDKSFKALHFPLNIDTTFVLNVDTNTRIPYEQVRLLGINFLKIELTDGLINEINKFCEIDSLKEKGKYTECIEKLDIGMTKKSIAYKIGVIDFKNNTKLFLWGITSSSYEACPFFSGTTIIGTFVNENKQNTHFVIARRSAGGDPPSMFNEDITAKILIDGKIEMHSIMVGDDLDIAGSEIIKQIISLKLEKDKIQIIDSKKEISGTEKRG